MPEMTGSPTAMDNIDDTQLAQMARLVEAAQSGKAELQRLADGISGVFVPVVITIAVATSGRGSAPASPSPQC